MTQRAGASDVAPRVRRDERGSATVEIVILFPIVLGILLLALQVALTQYGRTLALAAAESGARAGALETNSSADCYAAAQAILASGGDALTDAQVSCTRGAASASATVTGTTLSVLPWPLPPTSASATMPTERIS